jgi:hypothetical protein
MPDLAGRCGVPAAFSPLQRLPAAPSVGMHGMTPSFFADRTVFDPITFDLKDY